MAQRSKKTASLTLGDTAQCYSCELGATFIGDRKQYEIENTTIPHSAEDKKFRLIPTQDDGWSVWKTGNAKATERRIKKNRFFIESHVKSPPKWKERAVYMLVTLIFSLTNMDYSTQYPVSSKGRFKQDFFLFGDFVFERGNRKASDVFGRITVFAIDQFG